MNSKDYWLQRFIQEKAVSIKSQQTYEYELNKRLDQLLNIYDKDIKQWYSRFSSEFNIQIKDAADILEKIEYKHFDMTLQEFKDKAIKGGYDSELNSEYFKSQIARLNQLESQLKQQATELFSVEKFKMQDEMVTEYQHTYLHDIFNIQDYKGVYDVNFATLNTDKLRHVLSKPWSKDDGVKKNFSERLWGNYVNELPSQLMDSMLRNTLTGANYGKIQRDFRERFSGVQSKHIHRLVVTELGHVQEEATAESYKSQGIEKYEYVSTFERRTCDICSGLNGQIFKMSDRIPGDNYPLIHPYCRCTTVPYIETSPAVVKRWADGTIVQDMSFAKWQAMAS